MLSNKNIINRNLLDKKIIILFFFIIYFIIGNVVVNDYGIPFDEDYQRIIAQNRLDYIANFFSNIFLQSSDALKNKVEIMWPEYGVAFELPALWLEKVVGFSDTRSQSFFKHYLIFLVSFIGSIFFLLYCIKEIQFLEISTVRYFISCFFTEDFC